MIEMRWLTKKWDEWSEDKVAYIAKSERVLQYRYKSESPYPEMKGCYDWSEWSDVPEIEEE